MTEAEWNLLMDLFEKSRLGDEEAFCAVCEIVDARLKPIVKGMLRRKGIVQRELFEEAWQAAMLIFVRKGGQPVEKLRKIFPSSARALPNWLATIAFRCAVKNLRPQYSKKKKGKTQVQPVPNPPRQIGTKSITIDGRQHEVKVYSPCDSVADASRGGPLMVALTDSIIDKYGRTISPDDNENTDDAKIIEELHNSLEKLPRRWALAIQVVYLQGRSRTAAAAKLGCSTHRIYRILKMAKRRLREMLADCAREHNASRHMSQIQPKKPIANHETWVMGPYHDEIPRGIGPCEQSDQTTTDSWWPLVIDSLRRHTNLTADKEQLFFLLTADLGGNSPEDHGSGLLNCF